MDVNKIACKGISELNKELIKKSLGLNCCNNSKPIELLNYSLIVNNNDCGCNKDLSCITKDLKDCPDNLVKCPDAPEVAPDIKYARCALSCKYFTYKIYDNQNNQLTEFKAEWVYTPDTSNFSGKTPLHSTTVVRTIDRTDLASLNKITVNYKFDLQSDYDNAILAFQSMAQTVGQYRVRLTGFTFADLSTTNTVEINHSPQIKEINVILKNYPSTLPPNPTQDLCSRINASDRIQMENYLELSAYTDIIETTTFTSFEIERDILNKNIVFDRTITQTINGNLETFNLRFKPSTNFNCSTNHEVWWVKDDGSEIKVL